MSDIFKTKVIKLEDRLQELSLLCQNKKEQSIELQSKISELNDKLLVITKEYNNQLNLLEQIKNVESAEIEALQKKKESLQIDIDRLSNESSIATNKLTELNNNILVLVDRLEILQKDYGATQKERDIFVAQKESISSQIVVLKDELSTLKKATKVEADKNNSRAIDLMHREISVSDRERICAELENKLKIRNDELSEKEDSITKRLSKIEQKEEDLKGLEMIESVAKASYLKDQESLDRQREALDSRALEIVRQEDDLRNREMEFMIKQEEFTNRERIVRIKEKALHIIEPKD